MNLLFLVISSYKLVPSIEMLTSISWGLLIMVESLTIILKFEGTFKVIFYSISIISDGLLTIFLW